MSRDAVVVGAGIVGASTALELARAGWSVTVVDKAAGPGQGSTSASSAVVRFNFSTWAGVALSWESRAAWEDWAGHLEAPPGEPLARYSRSGVAMLDVPVAPRARYLPHFDRAGIPYEEWDADTLARRIPAVDPGRYWPPARLDDDRFWEDTTARLGAVWTPDAGYVSDPALSAVNLADAAARHGVQFVFRQPVTAVRTAGDRVRGVTLGDGRELSAAVVVNAAGPWSGQVNALAGVGADFTVSLRPMRQEVHHVRAPAGLTVDGGTGGAVVADMDLGTYFRGEIGGGLLVGGTEPECDVLQWLDDPDDVDVTVSKSLFDTQVTRAARRLPELAVPDRPSGVAGVYDVTDDWTPVYDCTDLPGFYVAVGTSGNQFKNAPVIGQVMTAIIEAVENGHDHDAHPVSFTTPRTGHPVDLGSYSRKRSRNTSSSGTVMG